MLKIEINMKIRSKKNSIFCLFLFVKREPKNSRNRKKRGGGEINGKKGKDLFSLLGSGTIQPQGVISGKVFSFSELFGVLRGGKEERRKGGKEERRKGGKGKGGR